MSQNKTVIQGLEPAGTQSNDYTPGNAGGFYSRGASSPAKGTIVPGMQDYTTESTHAETAQCTTSKQTKRTIQPGKPIVGFLYSVSRTGMGEYWPLQMGRNTIGQSKESDIVLPEGTVSSNHAVIVTRQIKSGIIAAITDSQSTNGTMINGESIGFSAEECHNGDVITIGNNYELYLILIDANSLGLSVSKDFIATETLSQDEEPEDDFPPFPNGATRPGGFNPYNEPPVWGGGTTGMNNAGGTVGLDGSVSGGNHGGTIPM